jgi:exosortase
LTTATNSQASANAPRPGRSVGAGERPRDLVALVLDPTNAATILLLGGAFVWYFHFWFVQQHRQAFNNSADWGHTYFVPLVSVYLLWQVRDEFARATRRVFWPGLPAVLLGIVSYVFFVVGVPNHLGQGLSMVLALFGLVVLMLGPRALRYCFFPVAYMVFAITLPEKWMIQMTFPLQLLASEGSNVILQTIGAPVVLEGNVLNVTDSTGVVHPLNVAEQCSGMRTLVSFVALGAVVCLVATPTWWKRVMIMAMTLPVALLLNILRVAVLAYLAQYNSNLAAGQAHTLIGTLLLIPGFFLYLGIVWALNKAVIDVPAQQVPTPPGAGVGA